MTFPMHAVLSLISGRLVPPNDHSTNGFHDMHGLAERVAGQPLYTHMFADRALVATLRERCVAGVPSEVSVFAESLRGMEVAPLLAAAAAFCAERPACDVRIEPEPISDEMAVNAFAEPLAGKNVLMVALR